MYFKHCTFGLMFKFDCNDLLNFERLCNGQGNKHLVRFFKNRPRRPGEFGYFSGQFLGICRSDTV